MPWPIVVLLSQFGCFQHFVHYILNVMNYIQEFLSCDFLLVCFACVWDVFTRFIVTTFLIYVSLHEASLTVRLVSPGAAVAAFSQAAVSRRVTPSMVH